MASFIEGVLFIALLESREKNTSNFKDDLKWSTSPKCVDEKRRKCP